MYLEDCDVNDDEAGDVTKPAMQHLNQGLLPERRHCRKTFLQILNDDGIDLLILSARRSGYLDLDLFTVLSLIKEPSLIEEPPLFSELRLSKIGEK